MSSGKTWYKWALAPHPTDNAVNPMVDMALVDTNQVDLVVMVADQVEDQVVVAHHNSLALLVVQVVDVQMLELDAAIARLRILAQKVQLDLLV